MVAPSVALMITSAVLQMEPNRKPPAMVRTVAPGSAKATVMI
jgi:hypothetical protein